MALPSLLNLDKCNYLISLMINGLPCIGAYLGAASRATSFSPSGIAGNSKRRFRYDNCNQTTRRQYRSRRQFNVQPTVGFGQSVGMGKPVGSNKDNIKSDVFSVDGIFEFYLFKSVYQVSFQKRKYTYEYQKKYQRYDYAVFPK